jgi:hypothetical protein
MFSASGRVGVRLLLGDLVLGGGGALPAGGFAPPVTGGFAPGCGGFAPGWVGFWGVPPLAAGLGG